MISRAGPESPLQGDAPGERNHRDASAIHDSVAIPVPFLQPTERREGQAHVSPQEVREPVQIGFGFADQVVGTLEKPLDGFV